MVQHEEEAARLLSDIPVETRQSVESISTASTTSLVLDRINERNEKKYHIDDTDKTKSSNGGLSRSDEQCYDDDDEDKEEFDLENAQFLNIAAKPSSRMFKRIIWIGGAAFIVIWVVALFVLLGRKTSESIHANSDASNRGNGKKVPLDQVFGGQWRAQRHGISWIPGADGEDGLLLEQGVNGKDYLIIEDVRGRNASGANVLQSTTLMKAANFVVDGKNLSPGRVWPSPDLKKVLIATNIQSNWRHSFYAQYWIFDVASQSAQPLDPDNQVDRIQLASWSPQSDAVVFTRENNMFLRRLSSNKVIPITTDGGPNLFYGAPDWVYEEEVFQGNSVTWWAEDGKYIAFLRTDESDVPEYPVQYFISRPSGKSPPPGEENYPEVREIKYPKAGAPNPIVTLQFYDVQKGDVFEVKTSDEFADDDRLITEIVWAGSTGKVIVRETNRASDILRVVLIDVHGRTGKTVRTVNVAELDGGWFEVSENTKYIPADPSNGRPKDGYIDTVIHENYDHLAYFTPLDNPNPILLTSGNWEVVNAPSAVDLKNNVVYFIATKESPIQRHVYSVKMDGSDLKPLTDVTHEGYYSPSFSSGAGYVLLNYDGPSIPWQKVINTPSNGNSYSNIIEENSKLNDMARKHDLPALIYSTITVDGYELQVVERRPPYFNEEKQYPVLFYLYNGPGSQMVNKLFSVDFQSYIAASLGYIVVTVDGRGTGFIGRKARSIVRGNLGYWESHDQIAAAKMWAAKKYVDAARLAIWGWSYGGFMTLKTLEQDAGQTFSYGMAVAPVTDWHFYDSIYTERYMHTPQANPGGYETSTINNATALQQNVRFLIMHGVADDNVHMQNSLILLDKLDLAGVENYDVHVFPDSDHGIYFHNANRIVYDKLNSWLINAFNGEWLKIEDAVPKELNGVMIKR